MDEFNFRAAIMGLRQKTKLIDWLAEGGSPYQHDICDRLEQISNLAAELSEEAQAIADNHRKENSND